MNVRSTLGAGATGSALLLLSLPVCAAEGADRVCPAATDTPYSVKMDDTLWTIAARQYCLNEWPPLFYAWRALARYNRLEIGSDPHQIHPGTVVCLPARVESGRWHADRCSTGESAAPATPSTGCGNGRREEPEICDGEELGGLTCETLGLPAGRLACRSDCKGFEVGACLQGGG
jgi:LysM domain-containing protein